MLESEPTPLTLVSQNRRLNTAESPGLTSSRMENCVIVNASGRQLDQLREEASRISRGHKVDWWAERGDKGTRFCFEDAEAKKAFASICENFAVQCIEI